MRTVDTYALPSQVDPEDLIGTTVVVIDVIRASTTIIHALSAGAIEVQPFLEVDDARAVAKALIDPGIFNDPGATANAAVPAEFARFSAAERFISNADLNKKERGQNSYLLGGERDAVVIDGFDLGNSPSDYTKERVANRIVLFTTTNGTRAMMRCRAAKQVFIGAFVNAAAVVERLIDQERIVLICAGTAGEETGDDLLLAGLLVDQLQQRSGESFTLNDRARETQAAWQAVAERGNSVEQLAKELAQTRGGQNLVRADLASDLLDVAAIDRFSIVPELDTEWMRIRLSR